MIPPLPGEYPHCFYATPTANQYPPQFQAPGACKYCPDKYLKLISVTSWIMECNVPASGSLVICAIMLNIVSNGSGKYIISSVSGSINPHCIKHLSQSNFFQQRWLIRCTFLHLIRYKKYLRHLGNHCDRCLKVY